MSPLEAPIPGETPLDDLSGLKIPGITTRAELNRHEAENISRVIVKYLAVRPAKRTAPFSYTWCLKLHQEMFGDVWRWAGLPRTCELNLGVPSYAIPENLALLLDDLHHWNSYGIDWVEQAARLHHRAVQIHPFVNGNGRWARLLANIWLKQQRQPLTLWPEPAIGTTSMVRGEYISAIQAADLGDYDPLIALHRQFTMPQS